MGLSFVLGHLYLDCSPLTDYTIDEHFFNNAHAYYLEHHRYRGARKHLRIREVLHKYLVDDQVIQDVLERLTYTDIQAGLALLQRT